MWNTDSEAVCVFDSLVSPFLFIISPLSSLLTSISPLFHIFTSFFSSVLDPILAVDTNSVRKKEPLQLLLNWTLILEGQSCICPCYKLQTSVNAQICGGQTVSWPTDVPLSIKPAVGGIKWRQSSLIVTINREKGICFYILQNTLFINT